MFGFTPKLPVPDSTRIWVDSAIEELSGIFGREALERCPIVLAGPEFFPREWEPTCEWAEFAFDRVCALMGCDRHRIDLVFVHADDDVGDALGDSLPEWQQSRRGAAGMYSEGSLVKSGSAADVFVQEQVRVEPGSDDAGARAVVSIDSANLTEPAILIATMAHEVAHVLLLGDRRIDRDRSDMEPLTDLAAVCKGFGVFLANSAMQFHQWNDDRKFGWSVKRLGYLDEETYGYALAVLAQRRGERNPAWIKGLRLNVKTYMAQSTKVLNHEARARRWFA
ncbi:MAG: hypothetical protein ACLQVD_16370 [Capsulimonadaceae bacterium]